MKNNYLMILPLTIAAFMAGCKGASGEGNDKSKNSADAQQSKATNQATAANLAGKWTFKGDCPKTKPGIKHCNLETGNQVPAVIQFFNGGKRAAILFYNVATLASDISKYSPGAENLPGIDQIANNEYLGNEKKEDPRTWEISKVKVNEYGVHTVRDVYPWKFVIDPAKGVLVYNASRVDPENEVTGRRDENGDVKIKSTAWVKLVKDGPSDPVLETLP